MIVTRLMGGMGNQMFQYAAGRRLALRHDTELVLDLGWFRYEASDVVAPRVFQLDRFPLVAQRAEIRPGDVARWERAPRRFPPRHRLRVVRQTDGDMRVDQRVLDAPGDVLLTGYWQSERYFADAQGVVRQELAFQPEPAGQYAGLDAIAGAGTAVAVHVRRGDYVANSQTSAFHGVLSRDYYAQALELVASRVGAARFLAFSDEPDWVERELAADLSLTVVTGGDAYQEMRLMTRCAHHVIANSSFGWWGAWLGERSGSVIVAPMRWFADPSIDTSSIVPERWMRL